MPELLSPAGDWECLRAAVSNGADAIYFGAEKFNARLRAKNFAADDLPEVLEYLHRRNKRGFLTLNTLIFTGELEDAARELQKAERAGVDAIIVQDLGLARLAQAIAPRLEVHASTQMTITSPEGLALARRLGIKRVVLARELSLKELERFDASAFPLEVFVHGALCVAYSGQCLTSEALGQRSANRGECAQACRMPYKLIVDGQCRELGERSFLLSPQDLAGLEAIPTLVRMGIACFKIEGRLKTPEYVAAVTRVYRKAIDRALSQAGDGSALISTTDRYELEMVFSRGLYSGWLHGVNHQSLVDGRYGKKRGAFVGRVKAIQANSVEILPIIPVSPGDGLVFGSAEDTEHEEGGRVFEIRGNRFYFGNGQIDFVRLAPGCPVWKTDDPQLNHRLRQTFSKDSARSRCPMRMWVEGREGAPLTLRAAAGGIEVRVESSALLQTARSAPLTPEHVRRQLGRLGDTQFELTDFTCDLGGSSFVSSAVLNQLRREAVAQLETRLAEQPRTKIDAPVSNGADFERFLPVPAQSLSGPAESIVLCRTLEHVDVALGRGIKTIYVDFEDVRLYRRAVAVVADRAKLFLATPRIQKPGEEGLFKVISRAAPYGVLVRNLGAIEYFRGQGLCLHGDFSLNVANPLTAEFLLGLGLSQLTVSYDLNLSQILALLRFAPAGCYELTIHQHMPMFHMEHCVFAAFLSSGTDYTNCGRPCDRHDVRIRDRVGAEHPVKADVGCRNTVFNARAQTGVKYFELLRKSGLKRFRIELLNETKEEANELLAAYSSLLAENITGEELWRQLRVESRLGVTKGSLQ